MLTRSQGFLCLPLLAILAACQSSPDKPPNTRSAEDQTQSVVTARIENAHVRLPILQGQPGAAYFVIQAGGKNLDLISIDSPLVEKSVIHESGMENGVSKMREIKDFTVAANNSVQFKPGGHHVMLHGLDPSVKSGQVIPLTFHFADGQKITVEAIVKKANEPESNPHYSNAGGNEDAHPAGDMSGMEDMDHSAHNH